MSLSPTLHSALFTLTLSNIQTLPKCSCSSTLTSGYAQQLRDLSSSSLNVRMAPDPSRHTIQHNLQKARMAAGKDGYIAVLYSGHGIQEPPTEAGELWCYDRSFEECVQQGGGPSE